MSFSPLFKPIAISEQCTLPNRLVMAPMTTTAGEADGSFSEQEIAYLTARARYGIGTILTPACYVHKSGHSFLNQVGCHSDNLIPSMTHCAEAINAAGGKSFLQIHHGGNAAREEFSGGKPWAPSAVLNRRGTSEMPQAMTVEQIQEVIGAFAAAAGRARRAGFTGIEIHGANTYLFQQFFSQFTNKRDDDYGSQTMENRCRFAREVVKAIRSEIGRDYPVWYRISPEEPEPDGYNTGQAIELLKQIVPLGVDVIHVSSWEYGKSLLPMSLPGENPTKLIKQAFPEVPVVGVGKIHYPEQAMTVIEDGIDLVAMGRELLFDAEWAEKVKSGHLDEIRTKVEREEDIDDLDVPDTMKSYLRKFYPENL